MPHLHMKAVDVVVDLLDAAEYVDKLSEQELRELCLQSHLMALPRKVRMRGPIVRNIVAPGPFSFDNKGDKP